MSVKKEDIFRTIYGDQEPLDGYISYAGTNGVSKFNEASKYAIEASSGICRAYLQDTYNNLRPGISGRPEFSRNVFEYFRPNESLPQRYNDIVRACDSIYKNVTLIRNVIDLMSDFACEGIRLVHSVKSWERFYNSWFKR